MTGTPYLSILPLIILLLFIARRRRDEDQATEIHFISKKRIRIKKGESEMQELAKKYVGKDVYMKTISGGSEDGILKEVVDNAAVLEKDGNTRVVNLDYVIRLMEYPKNKKGKRCAFVLD